MIKNDSLGRSRLDQKTRPEIKDILTSRYPRWDEGSWHFDKTWRNSAFQTQVILCSILRSLKMNWEDFRGVLYYESQPGARLTCSSGFLLASFPRLSGIYTSVFASPKAPVCLDSPWCADVWCMMHEYKCVYIYTYHIDDIMKLMWTNHSDMYT